MQHAQFVNATLISRGNRGQSYVARYRQPRATLCTRDRDTLSLIVVEKNSEEEITQKQTSTVHQQRDIARNIPGL